MSERLKAPSRTLARAIAFAKNDVRTAKAWMQRQALLYKHSATLERYNKHDYANDGNTLTIHDAFNLGLLKPTSLLSPALTTQVAHFTNTDVLNQWNDVTCEWMLNNGGRHPGGAIPLNTILRYAVHGGNTDMLDWLHQLKQPSEKIQWSADLLLSKDIKTAMWAFWHPELLDCDNPERLLVKCMGPNSDQIDRRWASHIDKPNTIYAQGREHILELSRFASNLMELYFREMPWQERWTKFVEPMAPLSSHSPTFSSDGIQGLLAGYVYICGMMSNAPLDVQKCLAAFKNSCHPKESSKRHEDAAPKAIRHAFFGGPPPDRDAPDNLRAWLLLMQGSTPMQAAQAWIAWQCSAPALATTIDLELPSNAFGPA